MNLLTTSSIPFSFQNQHYPVILDEMQADSDTQNQITPGMLEELYLSLISTSKTDHFPRQGVMTTPYSIALMMVVFAVDRYLISKADHENQIEISSKGPISFLNFMQTSLSASSSQNKEGLILSWRSHLLSVTLLDPCVGGGVFVLAMLNYILILLLVFKIIVSLSDTEYETFFTTYQTKISGYEIDQYIRSEIRQNDQEFQRELLNFVLFFLKNQIFSVDINPNALEIARIRLQARLLVLFPSEFYLEIAQLTLHTQHTDYIAAYTGTKSFQIILGNPPYISADNMAQILPFEKRQTLRQVYTDVVQPRQKLDIFFYFFKKSIDLLEEKGIIAFIVPNRILTNYYAQRLREYLLEVGMIRILVNFAVDIPVFQTVNVHPCIIVFQKKPPIHHEYYYSYEITDLSDFSRKNLYKLTSTEWDNISLSLVQQYKLFFTNISPLAQDFLQRCANLPQIQSIVTIHEATRRAHFMKRLKLMINSDPTLLSLTLQLSVEEWEHLPSNVQRYYASEVRGTNIHDFQLLPPKSKMLHPDLISFYHLNDKTTNVPLPFTTPTVFLRELGDHLHGVLIDPSTTPHLGYGGVYYFQFEDLNLSFGTGIEPNLRLSAVLLYLCSDIIATFYRLLFHTGAWGGALKYRSTYLARLPLIPFNVPLFGYLGLYLADNHQKITQYQIEHQKDAPQWGIIRQIEAITHLLLLYHLFICFPLPSLSRFPPIDHKEEELLISFQIYDKQKESSEEIEKFLHGFLNSSQIEAIKIWIANHPWSVIFPSNEK